MTHKTQNRDELEKTPPERKQHVSSTQTVGRTHPDRPAELDGEPEHDADDWDEVDEASWESFPASDPPAHWAGTDRAPKRRP